jgi:uncharacterized BrkB/YihY/UPF0761 family membrane protein
MDAAQQEFPPASVRFGVIKKFGDDNAGTLVTNFAYSAFVCIFPLLLVLVAVLSIVLAGDPGERSPYWIPPSGQFPVVGSQLGHNIHGLKRSSVIGLVIGFFGLLRGSTGLAQAGLFSMAQIWNLPGPDRPNYVARLGPSFVFLIVLGLGLLISTGLATFGTFGHHNTLLGWLSEPLAAIVNSIVYFTSSRYLRPRPCAFATCCPAQCSETERGPSFKPSVGT